MFSTANEYAMKYTDPVITYAKTINDEVWYSNGAFVILNDEGWVLTVFHLWDFWNKFLQDEPYIQNYYQQINQIQQNNLLSKADKKKKLSKINKDPSWLTNTSFWWGADDRKLLDVVALEEADLVLGRLEPFYPNADMCYPVIKNPKNLKPGTSLCKLGFPFNNADATYDAETNCFNISENVLPMTFFPLEGIYTRNRFLGQSENGKYEIKFLETSSPGLKGQSGGPIFDTKGVLWGIQCKTEFFDLDFCPTVVINGRNVVENQFLNVGLGIHPEVIVQFLSENGIDFKISD